MLDEMGDKVVDDDRQPWWASPQTAFIALLFGLFLLLAVVVLVALFRKELDATGVALAIISLMGGLGGGAILRLLSSSAAGERK